LLSQPELTHGRTHVQPKQQVEETIKTPTYHMKTKTAASFKKKNNHYTNRKNNQEKNTCMA
jgi:hypothetical protein